MKLRRLRLKNFRGIAEREVLFAEQGVTVVAGRNEAGKSSMIEALDVLLDVPTSSKSRAVRALTPAGQDVGTEVEAEIVCGPWHFTYFKRFNRAPATELRIHAPQPAQLTGKDAHDRARQLLDAQVDLALFRAVRLMQSEDPAAAGLAGSTVLRQALDAVVDGDSVVDDDAGRGGIDDGLLTAVAQQYRRYYTERAGRPAEELRDARRDAAGARNAYAEREKAVASVAADVQTLESALARKDELARARELARVADAELEEQLAQAELARRAHTEAQKALSLAAATARLAQRDVEERASRRKRLDTLRERSREATDKAAAASEAATAAAAAAEQAESEATAATELLEQTRRRWQQTLREKLAAIEDELVAHTVDAQSLAVARTLSRRLDKATARWEAAAASFTVSALGQQQVTVDGIAASNETYRPTPGGSVIEAAGVVRVVISAGADSTELERELNQVRAEVEAFCTAHALTNLDDAPARAEARTELLHRRTTLRTELDGPVPGGQAQALVEAQRRVESQRAAHREHHSLAAAARAEADRMAADIAELSAAIAAADGELTDAQADQVTADAGAEQDRAARAVDAARAQLDLLAVTDLDRRREQTDRQLRDLDREITAADQEALRAATRIEMCRTENRLDELADAQADAEAADAQLRRVEERAAAAAMLYDVLRAKRQESHARYVEPFRRRLEELSVPLFGPSVSFHVDEDLTIAARTVDGVTVDYQALSGGAREQVGLIARLAGAMLVDERDGVPVIIDDALGNSDDARTNSMADVLTAAGRHSQVIVLTCVPERYAQVEAAALVEV